MIYTIIFVNSSCAIIILLYLLNIVKYGHTFNTFSKINKSLRSQVLTQVAFRKYNEINVACVYQGVNAERVPSVTIINIL